MAASCAVAQENRFANLPALQRTLAPGGKLRLGVNFGAPSSAVRDGNTGELTGIAHDLGKEMARRLNVAFEPVLYRRSAEVVAALKTGEIDVAFVTFTAERAKEIDFSSPYLQIEKGALVAGDSTAKTLADIDRPGMRVAVLGGGTADSTLSSEFKNAAIVRALGIDAGVDLLRAGGSRRFRCAEDQLCSKCRVDLRDRACSTAGSASSSTPSPFRKDAMRGKISYRLTQWTSGTAAW